ncbi:MAG TPA: winged helix-turn-helix domain-containing protein, partial [Blastocatellia bacterium]|nr:winged helix-turn-helix domain-containing protein [Blastocatellia bacterium]
MPFPEAARLELPILQELEATGGSDNLRYLYDRLVRYFPQLTPEDLDERSLAGRSRWRQAVQRAGRELIARGELRRERARWIVTPKGRQRVEQEAMQLSPAPPDVAVVARAVTHKDAQNMLVEIGRLLGRHAEAEFDYYDVVWRDSPSAPRLSHVFEVQVAGSVDSALTRLKHAYDQQRSRPFLVIADERSANFAGRRLTGSFHEIWEAITVIGIGDLERLYRSLKDQE